jgi:hypothetical protein
MAIRFPIFIIFTSIILGCGAEKQPAIMYKKGDFWVSNFANANYLSSALW